MFRPDLNCRDIGVLRSVNVAKKILNASGLKHPIDPCIKLANACLHNLRFGCLRQRAKPALEKLDKATGLRLYKHKVI